MHPLGGAWTSDAGTFGENICENEIIGPIGGRTPGTPPRSTND